LLGNNAPTAPSGTSVRIGGQSALVSFISPGQVNVQAPSTVTPGPQALTVTTDAGTSAPYGVTVSATSPGLLAPASFRIGGRQHVVALFPDGATYVLPPGAIPGVASRRVRPGDTITRYGVGFGAVTSSVPAGQVV
jgi:uncharacterized protein (TIGR03437 family)